ncbi:MAG: GGDEF domain-containing protein [Candidatus Cryosericum sp.]
MRSLPMAKATYVEVYAILACIVLVILVQMLHDGEATSVLHRIFVVMVSCVALNICVEAASWVFDGVPGDGIHRLLLVLNGTDIVLMVVPSLLWLCYIVYYVTRNARSLRRLIIPLGIPLGYVIALAASAPANGLLFTVDSLNSYHRGPWFLHPPVVGYMALACATAVVAFSPRRVPRRELFPLLGFLVPPVTGVILQSFMYGLSLTLAGTVLGLLLVYISLQSQLKGTDYMTGLANRKQLDAVVESVVANPQPRQPTALLMIDVDDLKSINDTWGHVMGDRAIEQCAAILRKCFHYDDTVARYAGDEFVVVLRLHHSQDINAVMERLTETAKRMATPEGAPFALTISVGCAVFPSADVQTASDLYWLADRQMYKAKKHARRTTQVTSQSLS